MMDEGYEYNIMDHELRVVVVVRLTYMRQFTIGNNCPPPVPIATAYKSSQGNQGVIYGTLSYYSSPSQNR